MMRCRTSRPTAAAWPSHRIAAGRACSGSTCWTSPARRGRSAMSPARSRTSPGRPTDPQLLVLAADPGSDRAGALTATRIATAEARCRSPGAPPARDLAAALPCRARERRDERGEPAGRERLGVRLERLGRGRRDRLGRPGRERLVRRARRAARSRRRARRARSTRRSGNCSRRRSRPTARASPSWRAAAVTAP